MAVALRQSLHPPQWPYGSDAKMKWIVKMASSLLPSVLNLLVRFNDEFYLHFHQTDSRRSPGHLKETLSDSEFHSQPRVYFSTR